MNNKHSIHVKCNRDILWPILQLAKSQPELRDKCKLEGEKLIVNGISYIVNNLGRLLPSLAAFKAAQKMDGMYEILSSHIPFVTASESADMLSFADSNESGLDVFLSCVRSLVDMTLKSSPDSSAINI